MESPILRNMFGIPLREVFKKIITKFLKPLKFEVLNRSDLNELKNYSRILMNSDVLKMWFLSNATEEFARILTKYLRNSQSQRLQDILAIYLSNEKPDGYFVEFGACDGIHLSNTYMLEKELKWTGILCEPAKVWHSSLRKNRTALLDLRCVYSKSDLILLFTETKQPDLSQVNLIGVSDMHDELRLTSKSYEVTSISLNDLLVDLKAPKFIDYLSVDTEGTEFECIRTVDFETWKFGFISIEHNFTSQREQIWRHLTEKGYRQILKTESFQDDWYVHIEVAEKFDSENKLFLGIDENFLSRKESDV